MKLIWLLGLFVFISGLFLRCGISNPDYVKYEPATIEEEVKECEAAVEAFNTQIQGIIDGDCISCHNTQAIDERLLVKNDAANNRAVFLNYTGTDASKLVNHIQNKDSIPHGGLLKTEPTLEKVQAWLDEEANCE